MRVNRSCGRQTASVNQPGERHRGGGMWTIVDQVNVKGPAWSRRTKVKGPDHRASGVKLQLFAVLGVSLHFGKSFGTAFWQEPWRILARALARTFWRDHESRAHSEPCRRNNSTRSHSASGVHLRLFAVYVRVTALLAAFNNAAATDTRHAVRGPGRNHAAVARCLHNS